MLDIVVQVLTNEELVASFSSIILIILIGYVGMKKRIFPENTSQVLSAVLLKIIVPSMAITVFMNDLDYDLMQQGIWIFAFSIVIHILLIVLTRLLYFRMGKADQITLANMSTFGSSNLFGVPIVYSFFGETGVMLANIFNIPFRLFLFSYGYLSMNRRERTGRFRFRDVLTNPVTFFTLIGFSIWILQDLMPQVQVDGQAYGFLRIDQTAYWLYKPLSYLASMISPLAWLLIGAQLSAFNLKDALFSKLYWFYSVVKLGLVPTVALILMLVINNLGWFHFDYIAISTLVIILATPTTTMIISFVVGDRRASELTSTGTLLSTVLSVLAIPLWVLILNALHAGGII